MNTIFTRIIRGEIPCHKILEDENYLAFLEIKPIHPGHTLVIPKQETDDLFDLEDKQLAGLILFAKKVARVIRRTVPCRKIGVMVYGLEVPHAHIHLVPIQGIAGELNFLNAKPSSQEELAQMAEKIKKSL